MKIYSPQIIGTLEVSGSSKGTVQALSISSNTASMDCSKSDFFTLSLVSGSTTFLNATNVDASLGQTLTLVVTTATGSIVNLSSNIKSLNGAGYTPTNSTSGTDVLAFLSVTGSTLLMVPTTNFV